MPKHKKTVRVRRRRTRWILIELILIALLALFIGCVWALIMYPDSVANVYLQGRFAAPPTPTPVRPPVTTMTPEAEASMLPSAEPSATPTASPEPTPEPTPEPMPEPTPVALELPYYIEVDRGMQVVRVYTIGEDGQYSLLARQMICSTDKFGYKPKDGMYELNGEKKPWLITLIPGNYAQYATRISSTILFHSVTYELLYPNTLNAEAYEQLGQNVSAGCVRLLAEDAKWIYDNVPARTPVRFMSGSERDEALLESLAPPPLKSGDWDPTDPREDNPDYDASYAARHPEVTPALGVTPAPTEVWVPLVHASPTP